jgi:mannose-6-phosphate isomerase-like protein (cupin superfamily)
VFVYKGSGRTELSNDSGFEAAFNWDKGATFAIPLNVHFKHINRSTTEPALLFSITNMPLMMNLFHDTDFVFNCPKDFPDRFSPEVTDFSKPALENGRSLFSGNLVPSAYDIPLPPAPARGANGGLLSLDLSATSLGNHISEFPGTSYKKAHRHGAGAHVVLLTGRGYSLLWKGEHDDRIRVDWQPGAVIVPPEKWFHQHFNTGDSPARYLALRFGGGPHGIIPDYGDGRPTREGGDQIEYEDEDPQIREMFESEITRA